MAIGLFLCAAGIAFEIHSNLGSSPWSVFHLGLAKHLSITFGQASICTSFVIIAVVSLLGLKVGVGTILNMLIVAWIVDFFDYFNLISDASNIGQGILMTVFSMLFTAIGSYFYIGCELGCGPRDGLMCSLTQKTHFPVGLIRSAIELSVFLIGLKLGGKTGLGTLMIVLFMGPLIQILYKIFDFDVSVIKHKTLCESLNILKGMIKNDNKKCC